MPDVVSGVMAGTSLLSAKAGMDAADAAGDAESARLQLEIERDRFNKEIVEQSNKLALEDRADFISRRQRERELIDPIQEQIINLAEQGPDIEGAVARSDADVAQSFGLQREQMRRQRQRYGINPASGVMMAEERRLAGAQGLATVLGRQRARMSEEDRDWARKLAAFGTGNIRNAQATTGLQQLGVSGASGVYGDIAASEGANAQAAFGLSGKLFQDFTSRYDASRGNIPPPGTTDYGGGWHPGV